MKKICCIGNHLRLSNEFSQARLVEKTEKKGPGLVISYENCFQDGLTLVVHEDTSLPGRFF